MNNTSIKPKIEFKKSSSKKNDEIKIGVLAFHNFNKNIHNQVLAGLSIKNSLLYVQNKAEFSYLKDYQNRIISRPNYLSHNGFVRLLQSMTINMYISFSETWGNIILESMAGGVPCLASNTSSIFNSNDFLRNSLVIDKSDNSQSIFSKAKRVLDNYNEISFQCVKHVNELNKLADDKLKEFLNVDSN